VRLKASQSINRYEGRGQKSGEYRGFIPSRVLGAPEVCARVPVVTSRAYVRSDREGCFNKKNQLRKKRARLYALDYLHMR
jgi:hypothetical protein